MTWINFKQKSEAKFKDSELEQCYGFQIQPGSKWNSGLNSKEIKEFEKTLGFELPTDYRAMLLTINGLDRDQISIYPEGESENKFIRMLYRYPEDLKRTQWLVDEIKENVEYVNEALIPYGFNVNDVVGFVPLYAHRALVVFNDKSLSPVISIHQGSDVILYGRTLADYWERELFPDCDRS